MPSLAIDRLLLAEVVAFLSLAPLLAVLGPPARIGRALVVLLVAHLVPLGVLFLPAGRLVLGSDLGIGALVLALAAGVLVGAAATSPTPTRQG